MDLSTITSPYNFVLLLEQSETERILEERLNKLSVKVERETELLQTEDQGPLVLSQLRRSSGEVEDLVSSFVIGCDGAHSTVRRLLGIPFKGFAYKGDFILGDVRLRWEWPYGSVQLFFLRTGIVLAFPLKGEQRHRLILIPKAKFSTFQNEEINLQDFQESVSQISLGKITVLSATWLTRFHVHHRMVERFQKGRIFLAGDAAHIHSPAGGQGMNTGIQDSLNLGFKIKQVIARDLPFCSLREYEHQRISVARRVLRGTDFFFRTALSTEKQPTPFIERILLPKLVRSKFLQRHLVSMMSEVSIAHEEIKGYIS